MEGRAPAKYLVLRDELIRALRAGEFRPGDRLPSEREMAARFKITHVTVRRAISDLVELELLERRSRVGVYVREQSQEKLSALIVNVVGASGDSSLTETFLKCATQKVAQRGWGTRITRSVQGSEGRLLRAVQAGEPSVIFLDLPGLSQHMLNAMAQANGRAVMIGNQVTHLGIPSVLADDKLAVEMAVAHLRKAGHEKIAFLTSNPDHPVGEVQVAAWRGCFAGSVPAKILERRLLLADSDDNKSIIELGHVRTSAYLKQSHADATALISNNDMLLYGALFACQERGKSVPKDMSVMCTMDSNILKFMQAGVSVIDICMERQIDLALQMIESALSDGLPAEDRLRLVQPRFIDRKSVLPYLASK